MASALIRGALDDVRAGASCRVRPLCPFVKAFIQRHQDYQDLFYAGTDQPMSTLTRFDSGHPHHR